MTGRGFGELVKVGVLVSFMPVQVMLPTKWLVCDGSAVQEVHEGV